MKDGRKNIETSAVLGNEIRWQMVEIAGRITTEEFRFCDIVDKDKKNRSQEMQQFKNRWLQECFAEIIKAGIFSKVEGKYRYILNKEMILEHSEAIKQLTI